MRGSAMELRQLRYAVAVARHKSFTRAAYALHIAQPSLSQQIQKLEADLATTLFVRGRGGISLTRDGIDFISRAEAILRQHDDLEQEMRERREGVGGEVVIGAPAITGGHLLPPLLAAYQEAFPSVRVRLIEEAPAVLEDLAGRGITDITLMALPVAHPDLILTPLFTEPILAVLPSRPTVWMAGKGEDQKTDWLRWYRERRPLHLKELAPLPFVLLKEGYGFRQTVLELCAEAGFRPQVVFETGNIEVAAALVAYGQGVTLAPSMVRREGDRVAPVYAPLAEAPARTLVLAYRAGGYLSRAARELIQLAIGTARSAPPAGFAPPRRETP